MSIKFRRIVAILLLLAVINWIPTYSGEYNEERFINYDRHISRNDAPGNEEKVLAMTSKEVATLWQLEVVLVSPEEVLARKAAAAKQVADKWQLEVTP